ncbi:MBL fold metallo-hydrolase [Streptomyces antimycoticus]|uniref:MBL fold metallo-hydrolase n=1 Tax=Streptomyces antimycoticus TaxID=68175 RepID=A0A499UC58_9ACTN|nr:MBL fold metallo-hydrolase [Streptomyces antimycoticus]
MTSSPDRHGATVRLSRRRLSQLAAALVVVGAAGPVVSASPAAAGTDGHAWYARARVLAGKDPVLRSLVAALAPGHEVPHPAAPAPIMLFDNVAFLSAGWVSATAVLTDDGIILLDALGSPAEAEDVIVAGLRSLGADPGALRYVVVTHGHEDHFGGAQHIADRYGARVMMAPADWDLVTHDPSPYAPARDLEIADGQTLTLGGTTLRLYYTPGHTPGTVSTILPVWTGGHRHTAMLWGGLNPPTGVEELRTYRTSIHSFASRMREAKVDVELASHPYDRGLERAELLRRQPCGPNPFVLGRERTQRFMAVMDLMLRGLIEDAEGTAGTGGADAPET